jgi:hypothetical protein
MLVTSDTVICPGAYHFSGTNFVIGIASSGITLSGTDVELIDDGGTLIGINMSGNFSDVVIEGFQLIDFFIAVAAVGSLQDIEIRQLYVEGAVYSPIIVASGDVSSGVCERIDIHDNTIHDSLAGGVTLGFCTDSIMADNLSTEDLVGSINSNFILSGGAGNIVSGNSVLSRNTAGCNAIWLDNSNGNLIEGNLIDTDFKDASHINGTSSNNIFADNTVHLAESWQYSFWVSADADGNAFHGNEQHNGILYDMSDSSVLCVDSVGNDYLDGALYSGPDPNGGTCPAF